ncbi:MAG TPA: membrane protein insertion efficiency factor YidD [Candidatus Baltobacteraceae bacterium]|jgi:hypothetical protein|nr:membrane protein insertion efficiency factor YidD [Candidatus Baltobacteraceae bacterium]
MNAFQRLLMLMIRLYQITISPVVVAFLGPSARCRFTPSCSQYALDAIRLHGAVTGCWLGLRRLARCHPWGACGDDPVPSPKSAAGKTRRVTTGRPALATGGSGIHGS